jgi:hypothetical protein
VSSVSEVPEAQITLRRFGVNAMIAMKVFERSLFIRCQIHHSPNGIRWFTHRSISKFENGIGMSKEETEMSGASIRATSDGESMTELIFPKKSDKK